MDMAGNVYEIVSDWYNSGYYTISPSFNPPGPAQPTPNFGRGARGGAFSVLAIKTYPRFFIGPPSYSYLFGFRCAYTGTGDYVANGWRLRAISSAVWQDIPAASASLTFDSSNHAQVAFLDSGAYPRLAVYNGDHTPSPWEVFIVPGAGQADAVKLFLDASDHANLYYHTWLGWELAKWDGSSWSVESTPFPNGIWMKDATSKMHIVHCENNTLKYSYWNGSAWTTETVDTGLSGCTANPMPADADYAMAAALDASGRPHIVYDNDLGLRIFRYRYKDAGGWHSEDITRGDSGATWFTDLSLKIDAAGKPHLSYYNGAYLYYAIRSGGAWQFTKVDGEQKQIGWEPSLTLDSTGKPRISYYAYGNTSLLDQLRYATFDGSVWQKQVLYVEANNNAWRNGGRNSVLALDGGDRAGIVFLAYDANTNTGTLYFLFQPPP
jgi:hypothetical protein